MRVAELIQKLTDYLENNEDTDIFLQTTIPKKLSPKADFVESPAKDLELVTTPGYSYLVIKDNKEAD